MNSSIDDYLDHVDQWKFKLHQKLKRMTPAQRRTYWNQIEEQARTRGLPVVETEKRAKQRTKRVRRTG